MRLNLYEQESSRNHGCEAIVRATAEMLGELFDEIELFTQDPASEYAYGIDRLCHVHPQGKRIKPYSIRHYFGKAVHMLTRRWSPFYNAVHCNYLKSHGISLQIGGDNYCYGSQYNMLGYMNDITRRRGMRSVLWGASIEPDIIAIPAVTSNLKRYDLITARESLTFDALCRAGVRDNVLLCPDPAFALKAASIEPDARYRGAIGLNISPLVMRRSAQAFDNFVCLIEHILATTDRNIVLVPHVVLPSGDDREPLSALLERFHDSGRVLLIEDADCSVLKAHIAVFSFFVGARTHATIAAYSSCVPTLVLGYSVKARGIAKDIFGSDKDYVLSAQSLSERTELTAAFERLYVRREEIERYLKDTMADYIGKAFWGKQAIQKMLKEK